MRNVFFASGLLGAALSVASALAAPASYRLTDLAPDHPDEACGLAINAQGHVAGVLNLITGDTEAFVYLDGRLLRLGPGQASGINDADTIVGTSRALPILGTRAFIVEDLVRRRLDERGGERVEWAGSGVAADGTACGSRGGLDFAAVAVGPDGVPVVLDLPGDPVRSSCQAISPDGIMGGYLQRPDDRNDTAFVGRPGAWSLLPYIPGTSGNQIAAVNSQGTALVITQRRLDGSFDAYVWRDGQRVELPAFDRGSRTAGFGINTSGEIAGVSSGHHKGGVLVEPGGELVDLTSRLDAASAGWRVDEARAINDAGQITGCGRQADQGPHREHAILLTPE
jgi:hypothetical protein